jgi:MFS family permease
VLSPEPTTSPFLRAVQRNPWFAGLPIEVAILSAVAFCVALGFGIVAPAIPIFAKTFGVSAFQAGAVVAAFALVRFTCAPLAGLLLNRLGERVVLASGLMIVAASSAVAGLARSYDQLLVLRGVGGLGSVMFTVSALSLLLHSVGPDDRGRAAGAYQGGYLLGGIAGPAVGGLVIAHSIRTPFFVYAGTLGMATVVTLLFVRRTNSEPAAKSDSATRGLGPLKAALANSGYRAALTVNLANGFTALGLRTSLVPLFVIEVLHRSRSFAGLAFFITAIVQGLLLLPAGRMADERGRKPALLIGSSVVTLGMLILVVTHGRLLFVVAMIVLGAGGAFLGSAPSAVVGDIVGKQRGGSVFALYQMTSDLGAIVGPLVAGFLVDRLGFGAAFTTGAIVAALALGVTFAMKETRRST